MTSGSKRESGGVLFVSYNVLSCCFSPLSNSYPSRSPALIKATQVSNLEANREKERKELLTIYLTKTELRDSLPCLLTTNFSTPSLRSISALLAWLSSILSLPFPGRNAKLDYIMSLYAGNSNLSPFITLANWDKNEQEQVSKSRMNGKEEGKTRRGRRRGREGEKSNSLCEIDIKEIRIQRRLNQSCTHCDWIHRIFRKVPVSIKRSPNLSSVPHAFIVKLRGETYL